MIDFDVLIVGAGPAGASCAWKLQQNGISSAMIDKQSFPRVKLCAGWITPDVFQLLESDPRNYPMGYKTFRKLIFHVYGIRIPVKTLQYSIRRYEFDHWLIEKSRAPLFNHSVRRIRKEGDWYIVDERFRGKYLVGAGGTFCPVYKQFFKKNNPRSDKNLIVAMEEEFLFPIKDKNCYLWFFENGLPGYAWYVPKKNGYLNVGIGGKQKSMRKKGTTIQYYWNLFVQKLILKKLVSPRKFSPRGYPYYLKNPGEFHHEGVYLTGDAAGLASTDMGEGIGPAIQSGIQAAESISHGSPYVPAKINRWSLKKIIIP